MGSGGPEGELGTDTASESFSPAMRRRREASLLQAKVSSGSAQEMSVVLEGHRAGRDRYPRVREILCLAEQLVEDGNLNKRAKVLPLKFAFVDTPRRAD